MFLTILFSFSLGDLLLVKVTDSLLSSTAVTMASKRSMLKEMKTTEYEHVGHVFIAIWTANNYDLVEDFSILK